MTDKFIRPASLAAFRSGHEPGLRRQLVVGISTLLLAVLLAGNLGIAAFIQYNDQRAWRERQQGAVINVAQAVTSFVEHQENILSVIDSVGTDELQESPEILQDVLDKLPAILEIVYLDSSGQVLALPLKTDRCSPTCLTFHNPIGFRRHWRASTLPAISRFLHKTSRT